MKKAEKKVSSQGDNRGKMTVIMQDDPTVKRVKVILCVIFLMVTAYCFGNGILNLNKAVPEYTLKGTETFTRVTEKGEEEYEDETVCPVEFVNEDETVTLTVKYSFEEWEKLESGVTVTGYVYEGADGTLLAYPEEADRSDFAQSLHDIRADENNRLFGVGMAFALMAIAMVVMTVFAKHFTAYEQIWFVAVLVIAALFSLIFPEESANGVNGLVIMALYLLDTFLNIQCELLISKQSKWNFIVSVFVELTEIVICLVLMYRFATLVSTLFFWLPCDIISFINWHKHPDRKEEELTEVRTLKGWQEVLIIAGIVVWTVCVGYFLTTLR
ncbi:MAG: DUF819 family protein, partial [Lachnospiraceae bacterium]|nr:DUF819 family protein [Lachnospiraceae bacterium]